MTGKHYNNGNKNIVRMEKKATNHLGLIIVLIIALVGGGFGAYYLYEHRNEFIWDIPLPGQNDDNNGGKNSSSGSNKNGELIVPRLKTTTIADGHSSLEIINITASSKGYEISLKATVKKDASIIYQSEHILIDGYNTTAEFNISDSRDTGGTGQVGTEGTFRIDKTELDALGIKSFKNLVIYYTYQTPTETSKVLRKRIDAYNDFNFDNSRQGLVEIDRKNDTIISYYQTIEDKEYTYIYFDFKNEDHLTSERVMIKKLLINGDLYDYPDFNEEIYKGSETILYLKIPKKIIKEVNNFTVSFILIEEYKEENLQSVYVTTEYYKEF